MMKILDGTASSYSLLRLLLILFFSLHHVVADQTTDLAALAASSDSVAKDPATRLEFSGMLHDELNPFVVKVLSSRNAGRTNSTTHHLRKLQSAQRRSVLVVRVNGAGDSQALASAVFTDLFRQMSQCSRGHVQLTKSNVGGGSGIISVQVGLALSQNNIDQFVQMAETAALQNVNGNAQGWSNIRQAADHVIIILPVIQNYKYVGNGELNFEAGAPSIPGNGYTASVGAHYGTSLSLLMHEIGKNLQAFRLIELNGMHQTKRD